MEGNKKLVAMCPICGEYCVLDHTKSDEGNIKVDDFAYYFESDSLDNVTYESGYRNTFCVNEDHPDYILEQCKNRALQAKFFRGVSMEEAADEVDVSMYGENLELMYKTPCVLFIINNEAEMKIVEAMSKLIPTFGNDLILCRNNRCGAVKEDENISPIELEEMIDIDFLLDADIIFSDLVYSIGGEKSQYPYNLDIGLNSPIANTNGFCITNIYSLKDVERYISIALLNNNVTENMRINVFGYNKNNTFDFVHSVFHHDDDFGVFMNELTEATPSDYKDREYYFTIIIECVYDYDTKDYINRIQNMADIITDFTQYKQAISKYLETQYFTEKEKVTNGN